MRQIIFIALVACLSPCAWSQTQPERFAEYQERLEQRREAALDARRRLRQERNQLRSRIGPPERSRDLQNRRGFRGLNRYSPTPRVRNYYRGPMYPAPAFGGYYPQPALRGYVPQPALRGYAPQPALRGYAPQPALRGYAPQPALRGYTPRPALTP